MIDARALEVRFGLGRDAVYAVRGVDLTVPEGAAVGIVGESGSGKSTILRAIAGLAPVTGGRLEVAGMPLKGSRRDIGFRRQVQMVFQDPYGSLHPRHTVDRILAEPCAIHGLDRPEARIEAVLRAVGLGPKFRFRYPHQLSGGQRQRVAIARALILEPAVLLLDEPTSALDVSVQAEILNLLAEMRRTRGLTYLFVSHNLSVVGHLCRRVAIMTEGRVVEEADAARLADGAFRDPYARRLWQASRGYDRALARTLAVDA
jgi:ABC-type dipeptide/oligopeptide/nickel transport system ATPase subunit